MQDYVPPPYTLYAQIDTYPGRWGTNSFISVIAFKGLGTLIIPKFFNVNFINLTH